MILTHTGKLGDFAYALPVASWLWGHGEKTHWVLTSNFEPFTKIESFLYTLPFTEQVSLVDFPVEHWRRGGQPWMFRPSWFGTRGEYKNLGFPNYGLRRCGLLKCDLPREFISKYYADMCGLGYDPHFRLGVATSGVVGPIASEHVAAKLKLPTWDIGRSILENLKTICSASERHLYFSGMASLMYFTGFSFTLYRTSENPPTEYYFPDTSRLKIKRLLWL